MSEDKLPGHAQGGFSGSVNPAPYKEGSNECPLEKDQRTLASAVSAGTHLTDSKITVADFAKHVAMAKVDGLKPASVRRVQSMIANHLERTTLGSTPLSKVASSDIELWKSSRQAKLSPTSARHVFRFVRSVFAWAVADKRIQTSPFSIMVKAPKTSPEKVVPLTSIRPLRSLHPLRTGTQR